MRTHTPTPWTIGGDLISSIETNTEIGLIWSQDRRHRAAPLPLEVEGNRQFILTACNLHDELLQALRCLTQEIDLSKLNIRKDFSLLNAHASAMKTIFKAEGREP